MNDEFQTLKFRLEVQVSARAAYQAFINPVMLQEWLCDKALANPVPEGSLYFGWNSGYAVTGQYIRLEPDAKVVFLWQGYGEPGPSEVKVNFSPTEDHLEIQVTHGKIGTDKAGKKQAKEIEKGWLKSLENLKSVLETGQDLRVMRRPFLGVYGLEPVTAETAELLGLTVQHGLRVLGVVEGAPAHAAGLIQDDVITRLDGERLETLQDFQKFTQTHRSGDVIKVVFHRSGEKQSAMLELGKRPLPVLPGNPQSLLEQVEQAYLTGNQTLAKTLAGVKESEANYHSQPEAWNVKENLAHLIAVERDLQAWLSGMLDGAEDFEPSSHANHSARLKGLVAANSRCRTLQSEIRRATRETVSLLQFVLPKLVERKGTFWRLSDNLTQLSGHFNEHIEQIAPMLLAARQANAQVAAPAVAQAAGQGPSPNSTSAPAASGPAAVEP